MCPQTIRKEVWHWWLRSSKYWLWLPLIQEIGQTLGWTLNNDRQHILYSVQSWCLKSLLLSYPCGQLVHYTNWFISLNCLKRSDSKRISSHRMKLFTLFFSCNNMKQFTFLRGSKEVFICIFTSFSCPREQCHVSACKRTRYCVNMFSCNKVNLLPFTFLHVHYMLIQKRDNSVHASKRFFGQLVCHTYIKFLYSNFWYLSKLGPMEMPSHYKHTES
jgi:hypothetical protein